VVATQARLWANGSPAMSPSAIAGAAERALDESRAAIHALTGQLDEPLDAALMRLVDDLEGRLGLRVMTDLQPVVRLPEDVQTAVLRAAREALVNAGHHSGADRVQVRLTGGDDVVHLTVCDAGRGFDPAHVGEGFGLEVARSRLAAIGGTCGVSSAAGEGTTVEVSAPSST
jgi:signal transduction histidine kinase